MSIAPEVIVHSSTLSNITEQINTMSLDPRVEQQVEAEVEAEVEAQVEAPMYRIMLCPHPSWLSKILDKWEIENPFRPWTMSTIKQDIADRYNNIDMQALSLFIKVKDRFTFLSEFNLAELNQLGQCELSYRVYYVAPKTKKKPKRNWKHEKRMCIVFMLLWPIDGNILVCVAWVDHNIKQKDPVYWENG